MLNKEPLNHLKSNLLALIDLAADIRSEAVVYALDSEKSPVYKDMDVIIDHAVNTLRNINLSIYEAEKRQREEQEKAMHEHINELHAQISSTCADAHLN